MPVASSSQVGSSVTTTNIYQGRSDLTKRTKWWTLTSPTKDQELSDDERKLFQSMNFPPEFEKIVDMRKVKVQAMSPWITKKIISTDSPSQEDASQSNGFLTRHTAAFMSSLWRLLLEAQSLLTVYHKALSRRKEEGP